jgi:hypothetical protein
MVTTPGVGGYLVAWLVSVLVCGIWLFSPDPVTPGAAVGAACLLAPFSAPFAGLGIVAVHVACRDVPAQWVHVLAAGLAGAATGAFWAVTLLFAQYQLIWVVGVATAAGRLAVVPLVWLRRRAARDSAGSPARC